ncbi:MAG: hypothetical protein L0206_04060, partial [Actinobacteria bacterium]|nr:hypothetical protein [Actinomycetota bacterium]
FTPITSVVYEEGAFSRDVLGQIEFGTGGRMVRGGEDGNILLVNLVRAAPDGRFQAGFTLFDISDPRDPQKLSTYRSEWGANEGEGAAITGDAQYAFVPTETVYSLPPTPASMEIVDISDPTNPRLAQRIPWTANPHIVTWFESDGVEYLAVSDYEPDLVAAYTADSGGEWTNRLWIWRFDRDALTLEPAARYTFGTREKSGQVYFPHDSVVTTHPVSGELLLYLGAFAGGGRVLSLEGSLDGLAELDEVGYTVDAGSSPILRHHSFDPAPLTVDGVLATAAVPRSHPADPPGSAYLALYDTADPSDPVFLGEWRHPDDTFPPGAVPHVGLHVPVFSDDATRLYVPHYHAGLFVFDTSSRAALEDLCPIAYWTPPGEDVQSGAPYATSVIMAIEVDGVVLVTDRSAGRLYALELDL